MGLTQDYTTAGGLTATGAYHRISAIHIDIDKNDEDATMVRCHWNVEITKDKVSRDEDKPLIGGFSFYGYLDLSNSKNQYNLVKQGYETLKLLDGYSGAVDA
jgi:hypothetical protein